jgi:cystathionine beta-lyase
MERQERNTKALIGFLSAHPAVAKIYYPTIDDAERRLQVSQARGSGAVFSMTLAEGYDPAAFIAALKLFDLAVSLGAVESLICYPATMTHESFPEAFLQKIGITKNLLRLSVGIEHEDDLIADVRSALAAAQKKE